ncbi:hypothetical protein K7X08_011690 [Anisodus acutangulus]|uniref:Uncharacterized protein n=1 Tax=Anisodus acutangulus TaxID=402998 RepID=A0A9Q1RLJ2_9SOLA|nr:hypothetical protein K7X08_011690 [Anisodus acutangulus]
MKGGGGGGQSEEKHQSEADKERVSYKAWVGSSFGKTVQKDTNIQTQKNVDNEHGKHTIISQESHTKSSNENMQKEEVKEQGISINNDNSPSNDDSSANIKGNSTSTEFDEFTEAEGGEVQEAETTLRKECNVSPLRNPDQHLISSIYVSKEKEKTLESRSGEIAHKTDEKEEMEGDVQATKIHDILIL